MATYRVLIFSPSGQVSRTFPIELGDDESAARYIANTKHDSAVEVWQGDRMVARRDPPHQ